MKSILTLTAISVISAYSPTSFAELRYWPLLCRGGGNIEISSYIDMNNLNDQRVYINFEKAPIKAGENGKNLKPGQCSWVDRGMWASSPTWIRDYSPNKFSLHQLTYGDNRAPRTRVHHDYSVLEFEDNVITLMVTNTYQGYFDVK